MYSPMTHRKKMWKLNFLVLVSPNLVIVTETCWLLWLLCRDAFLFFIFFVAYEFFFHLFGSNAKGKNVKKPLPALLPKLGFRERAAANVSLSGSDFQFIDEHSKFSLPRDSFQNVKSCFIILDKYFALYFKTWVLFRVQKFALNQHKA